MHSVSGSNLYYMRGQSAALIGSPPFLKWFGGDIELYYVTRSNTYGLHYIL